MAVVAGMQRPGAAAWSEEDTPTLLVGAVAGPGGGFDINAADCDRRAFSSKVINRQAALWLPSSSSELDPADTFARAISSGKKKHIP